MPSLSQLRRQLAASLKGKRLLYLDLLYWNHLCDTALNPSSSDERSALLASLRLHVRSGSVVCPIEFTTFLELHKQRLLDKRRLTAELIDELSTGLVIISPPERCFLEAIRFVQSGQGGDEAPVAPREDVWTRPAFVVGHGELVSKTMKADDLERLQDLLRDRLWGMGFTNVLQQFGADFVVSFEWAERAAQQMNEAKQDVRANVATYREAYLGEVRGFVSAYIDSFGDAMVHLYERAGGNAAGVSDAERARSGEELALLVAAAFEKHDLSKQLPTVHISAALHASANWDTGRRYKANDIQDFGHAAAALGYCDAFATERSLANLIRQSRLHTIYPTQVMASVSEVLGWLGA